jgi:hypothetical protein
MSLKTEGSMWVKRRERALSAGTRFITDHRALSADASRQSHDPHDYRTETTERRMRWLNTMT